MKTVYRGFAVAVLQCLVVLSVAGKYALDRQRLPRAWAIAVVFDPYLPVRGRYVSLRLQIEAPPGATQQVAVRLSAVDGRLLATPDPTGAQHIMPAPHRPSREPVIAKWLLSEPVPFFIPDGAPDPTRHAPGQELWVEVTVPAAGSPRPIRLTAKPGL